MPLPYSLSNAMINVVPVGTILPYAGTSLPAYFLWCDGSNFGSAYPKLSTALGGATTTPDLRGRTLFGKSGSGSFVNVGTTGGAYNTALSADHVPPHAHNGNTGWVGDHNHGVNADGWHGHGIPGAGNHNHGYDFINGTGFGGSPGGNRNAIGGWGSLGTPTKDAHAHNLSWVGDHNHGISWDGGHQHSFWTANNSTTSSGFSIVPPYCTLNYIIKAVD